MGERKLSPGMVTKSRFKLLSKIHNGYREERYTDITFKVGTGADIKVFKAYKVVLRLSSPVFATMFDAKWNPKSEIHLPDDDPDTFENLLDYLHGYNKPDDLLQLIKLLSLADKYDVSDLVSLCQVEIRRLALSECQPFLDVYHTVKAFNFDDIAEQLYRARILRFPSFTNSSMFLEIDKELLLKILDEDDMRPKEEDIFFAVFRWLKHKAGTEFADKQRRPQLPLVKSLIKHIRFECLHPRFLTTEVKEAKVLSSKALVQAICDSSKSNPGFFRKCKRDKPLKRLQ